MTETSTVDKSKNVKTKTLKAVLNFILWPIRFLIALDRNEIGLNHEDREYLKWKKENNQNR